MKLNATDLFLLCQCAVSAANKAGQIISQYSRQDIITHSKKGGDSLASQVVTEVDLLSQEVILKVLLPTCEKYDLALLTEESDDDKQRLEKDYFWCIDPLDGTLPFIEKNSGYAVSIALVAKNGSPCIGVIYDPATHTLYQAIKNQGAMRNNQPWLLDSTLTNNSLSFIADRSFKKHKQFKHIVYQLKIIAEEMGLKGLNTILHGGAAMNACWVMENQPACYFKFPKTSDGGGSLWDYAASSCIFLEAGMVVSDIFGALLDLNRIDSTYMNHHGVLYASDFELAQQIKQLYSNIV